MPIRKRNAFIPRNQRIRLTSAVIIRMAAGRTDYFVKDEEIKKLHLKVTPSGGKSFVLRYRNADGYERKLKLGEFPNLNTTVARKLASEALLKVAQGADPAADKADRRKGQTLAEYSKSFMINYAEIHLRPSTLQGYRQVLNSVLIPALGSKKLQSITRNDVAQIQRQHQSHPYQANRSVGLLRRLYNYAEEHGDVPEGTNPTKGVRKFAEEPRERLLSDEEMGRIGDALDLLAREHPEAIPAYSAIQFLFLTGCRKSEALRLRWPDIDFARGVLKFTVTKTVPRSQTFDDTMANFLQCQHSRTYSDWVFPGRNPDNHLTDLKKSWAAVKKIAGIEGVRLHDIRHTVLSDVASMSDVQTAAQVGGHKSIRSTMRYIHGRSEFTKSILSKSAQHKAGLLLRPPQSKETDT